MPYSVHMFVLMYARVFTASPYSLSYTLSHRTAEVGTGCLLEAGTAKDAGHHCMR